MARPHAAGLSTFTQGYIGFVKEEVKRWEEIALKSEASAAGLERP